MVKHLHYLLSGNGFFRKTVQHTQIFLLSGIGTAASFYDGLTDEYQKGGDKDGDKTQKPVGHQHKYHRS